MREFISIIVPYFNRLHYLTRLINSVHENADIPFELIIHDDGSTDGSQIDLLKNSPNVSTIVYNTGEPMGLAASVDRLVALANSEYIIMLNADCIIIKPDTFSKVVTVLKNKFVGTIPLIGNFYGRDISKLKTNCPFGLHHNIGSGAAIAFRKSTFNEIGGWHPNEVGTCNSDVDFGIRVFKAGYFTAMIIGSTCVQNLSQTEHNMNDSTIGTVRDASFTKLFNYDEYEVDNDIRRDNIYINMEREYKLKGGNVNNEYWSNYIANMFTEDGKIIWEYARIHNKFKGDIC